MNMSFEQRRRMEGLLFGTGNASLPLYNGLLSILCVGVSCALLVCLLCVSAFAAGEKGVYGIIQLFVPI